MLERLSIRLDESPTHDGCILLKSLNGHQVSFPRLRSLHLSGWTCEGGDLIGFLQKHTTLRALQLSDMNFVSRIPYSWILRQIANILRLDEFRSWQIAERGFRTRFTSLIDTEPACKRAKMNSLRILSSCLERESTTCGSRLGRASVGDCLSWRMMWRLRESLICRGRGCGWIEEDLSHEKASISIA